MMSKEDLISNILSIPSDERSYLFTTDKSK